MVREASGKSFSIYGYVPTEWVTIVFIVLFASSTVIHLGQSVRSRIWWLIPTVVLCGLSETIGWAGRFWSSRGADNLNAYLMQITTTIIAPTFLLAANFIILGNLIKRVGIEYSRLGPNMYAFIFISADFIALIVQAVGGASASIAVENNKDVSKGGHIMLGGIVFQTVSIVIYTILSTEFLTRVVLNKPAHRVASTAPSQESTDPSRESTTAPTSFDHDKEKQPQTVQPLTNSLSSTGILDRKTKLTVTQLALTTLFIFIRSVYRTIELSNGFAGPIIHNQVLFNVLDGAMIVLAMVSLNVLHPGNLR